MYPKPYSIYLTAIIGFYVLGRACSLSGYVRLLRKPSRSRSFAKSFGLPVDFPMIEGHPLNLYATDDIQPP